MRGTDSTALDGRRSTTTLPKIDTVNKGVDIVILQIYLKGFILYVKLKITCTTNRFILTHKFCSLDEVLLTMSSFLSL